MSWPKLHIHLAIISACIALGTVPLARAASFDCTAARAPVERMICGTPDIDALDTRLAGVYRDAIAAAPWRRALRDAQRIWLTGPRDAAAAIAGPPALAAEYRRRIAALEVELERATDPAIQEPDAARALGSTCLLPMPTAMPPEPACSVRARGSLPTVAGQRLAYAVYDYGADGPSAAGSGVLVFGAGQISGHMRLLIADLHIGVRCEAPSVIGSAGRAVLQIPCVHAGTQAANDESVFGWADGGWRELDVRSWRRELLARLPREVSIRRGIYPDYGSMTLRNPLWGGGDPDCCATHGSLEADLVWNGDRLEIRAVRIRPQPVSIPQNKGALLPELARQPDPSSLARHPAVQEALSRILGRVGARQVAGRLAGPSVGVDVVAGRWVAGSACMPHACSVEETFLAYDTQTDTVFVAALRNSKAEILTPFPPWPVELVERLRVWSPAAAALLVRTGGGLAGAVPQPVIRSSATSRGRP